MGRSDMYIQPNYDSVNMCGSKGKDPKWIKRLKQKVLDASPSYTIKEGKDSYKNWQKTNEILANPAFNRFIMGIVALFIQPVIDRHNHKVDEETREVSRIRTISKIIAGTTVGVAVRGSCHELVKALTNPKGKKDINKILLPPKDQLLKIMRNPVKMANYRSTLTNILSILVMCATNFLVDAPFTIFLTNLLNEKRKENAKLEGGLVNE